MKLRLTDRALSDLDGIDRYSEKAWGRAVADRYIGDLSDGLERLAANPSLFGMREDYTGRLRFYRVREHVLIGDRIGDVIYVLTVWWAGMDMIHRLHELEPELMREAEILASRIETELP